MEERKPVKVSLSWSGGKDSALALWYLLRDPQFEVVRLHTVFGEETRRVGMHGIRETLVQKQAEAAGLSLDSIYFPASGDNTAYEKAMSDYLDAILENGINYVAYGDIFLEDLKKYRESRLGEKGIKAVFPLWGKNTAVLSREFLDLGFSTLICAADADKIFRNDVGKAFDHGFLAGLDQSIDPCGENGEFHTFCFRGPVFNEDLPVYASATIKKSYTYQDADGETKEKHFWFSEIELKN